MALETLSCINMNNGDGSSTLLVQQGEEQEAFELIKEAREKEALHEFRAILEEYILTNRNSLDNPPPRRHDAREKRRKTTPRVASCSSPDASLASALNRNYEDAEEKQEREEEVIMLWGVPLSPYSSGGHSSKATNAVLLKFLRAKELKVADALDMLWRALQWRRHFGADGVLRVEDKLTGFIRMDGIDRQGRLVCYNSHYGVLGTSTGSSTDEAAHPGSTSRRRREQLLRWRVQVMEAGARRLMHDHLHNTYCPSNPASEGASESSSSCTMLQVIDLKDSLSRSLSVSELSATTSKFVSILNHCYPNLVAKHIFINVPLKYYAYQALLSQFLSPPQNTSKFIFATTSRATETLLKFIAPEDLPIQYGGFKRDSEDEFKEEKGQVSEIAIKAGGQGIVEIPMAEAGVTAVWDLTAVGWEVSYMEEFVPDDEGCYRVLIQKEKQLEQTTRNSFYISEPGKVVITAENRTNSKKRLLYRSKTKPTIPLYNLLHQTTTRTRSATHTSTPSN